MSGYDMHRGDDPAYGLSDKYATDLFTQEAIRIIEQHELPRPLYLQLSHLAVHAPLESPQDYGKNMEFMHIREPNRRKYASTKRKKNKITNIVDCFKLDYKLMHYFSHIFLSLGIVAGLDESVGKIVHALGEKGMLSDTLILFLTDNGAPSIGRFRNWGSNYPLRGVRMTTTLRFNRYIIYIYPLMRR